MQYVVDKSTLIGISSWHYMLCA